MKRVKRLLCMLITIVMVVSICAVGFTAQAATINTAETSVAYPKSADDFTWDNATVYFLLTDRFNNGNKSNDHSYNRGLNRDGSVVPVTQVGARGSEFDSDVAYFQGGDFKGITEKLKAGYFDDLGVNAIWVAGWFEQIHGYVVGGEEKKGFGHYSYHGYYGLDFTELDKNFGTEAEFKEMIDTAHEHGIRIVLDVVMNHPGYNSIYDMNEYGYGTLTSNAMDAYYNFNAINQDNYHSCIKYNDGQASDWAKWWGRDWLRAGMAGYDNNGSGDLTGSAGGLLPDFKTENTATVELPQLLKNKWTKEGTYTQKVNEINETFSKYNLGNKTVLNYLVAWYTKWVEEYGIDGFRCDTAKHIEASCWKKLSEACTKALENWRKENPSAVGADWDEEFWMTGEHFGQGVSNNHYYQNGFDSMINFSFSGDNKGNNCNGLKNVNISEVYSNYASQINSNPNFNVLTYISSHDTGLCRNDIYYQGSAFLLLPGGVQIFYGDESNRSTVDCSIADHKPRSFMNWSDISSLSSTNGQILAHWQKVGQFRNNHVAVGAGSHVTLNATSGTAFARTYDKNGVKDNVVCVIGANNNTNVTITLNNAFANGTELKNTYTGDTATVENGKVTFNSGAHGTILLEATGSTTPTVTEPTTPPTTPTNPTNPTNPTVTDPTESTPTIPVVPTEYVILGDSDLSEKVNVKDATLVQKHVAGLEKDLSDKQLFAADADGSEKVNVKDATAIQKFVAGMDTGYAIGEKVVYKQGTETDTTPTVTTPTESAPAVTTPTATDPTEPSSPQQPEGTIDLTKLDGQVIVLINSSYSPVYQHSWTDQGDAYNTWPGELLQDYGDYKFAIIPDEANRIIFNNGSDANKTADLEIPGEFAIYDMAAGAWSGSLTDYVDVTQFPIDTPPTNPPTESTPSVSEGNYVYFKDDLGWGSAYCHYWSDASGSVWPGEQMESLGNNLYRFLLPDDATGNMYQNVVFNIGSNAAQTPNLIAEIGRVYNNQSNTWEDLT